MRCFILSKLNGGSFSSENDHFTSLTVTRRSAASPRNTHVLKPLSYSLIFKNSSSYSSYVTPAKMGIGASTVSIRSEGTIGTMAQHQLSGRRSYLRPITNPVTSLRLFPTTITDFSSNTDRKSLRRISKSSTTLIRVAANQYF